MATQKEDDSLALQIGTTNLTAKVSMEQYISNVKSATAHEPTSPLCIVEPVAKHKYDTMDPVVFTEIIKDSIEQHTDLDEYKSENKSSINVLQKQIFKDLKCDSNEFSYLQKRIKIITDDIYRQNGIEIDTTPISTNVFEIYNEKDIDIEQKCFQSETLIKGDKKQMEEIKNAFKSNMDQLLQTKQLLKEQCHNENCTNKLKQSNEKNILMECPCLQRVCVFLNIIYKFRSTLYGVNAVNPTDYFQINDTYDSAALQNDFQHVQIFHIANDHQMQQLICKKIQAKYPCLTLNLNCYYKIRHHKYGRIRHKHIISDNVDNSFISTGITKNDSTLIHSNSAKANTKDVTFSQLIDGIHCYFLHSDVQYGCHFDEVASYQKTVDKQKKNALIDVNELVEEIKSEELESEIMEEKHQLKTPNAKYIGRNEDKKWIESIERLHNPYQKHNQKNIYERLVKKMGVYRWQGTHSRGCQSGTGLQDLVHVKPKYKNVKEEALKNKYHHLPIENWNQTVTKVTQFKRSFAAERIRTSRDGKYYDVTMEHEAKWKKGETPTMKEITVIKLYTDWDKLQSELKKCFRLESVDDIVKRYSPARTPRNDTEKKKKHNAIIATNSLQIPTVNLDQSGPQLSALKVNSLQKLSHSRTSSVHLEEAVDNLKYRITEFFHWRANLLIFINKFSQIILPSVNDKEFILYHGVNSKMILNPSSTTSYFGPLSTSASYYVAQTFSTDRGMIMALSSQYPRAKLCNAFNASIISDYPEEQEYLIGHIYMRIRRVYTKSFDVLPFDSKLKNAFFVLHLFREQIFSMNTELETYLIPFIQLHLKDVMQVNDTWLIKEINGNNKIQNENYKYLRAIYKWGRNGFKKINIPKSPNTIEIDDSVEEIKKSKLVYIMIKKFMEFVTQGKLKQILKLDCISPGLRPYFLKKSDEKCQLKKRYNGLQEEVEQYWYEVSFNKVISLFPNTEQIQFFNWYKFDDKALKKLINQIRKDDNKLKYVKFLYYDYNNDLNKYQWFFNGKLNESLLDKLDKENWKINRKEDKVGYCIKLKQK